MATTILTAEGATRRTETTAKATYAPLVVLALAQIGTSSDSAAMNLATASLVGTLGATLDDIQMATTLFSLIAGAFMIAGGLIGVTIGLRRTLAIGLSWPRWERSRRRSPRHLLVHLGRARCHGTRRLLGHALGARPGRGALPGTAARHRVRHHRRRGRPFDALAPDPGHRHGLVGLPAHLRHHGGLLRCSALLRAAHPPHARLRRPHALRRRRHRRGRPRHGTCAVRRGAPVGLGHR
ncbi:MAG: hypothetical protein ACLTDR_06620 [Adlercreutzia equolifaciens]